MPVDCSRNTYTHIASQAEVPPPAVGLFLPDQLWYSALFECVLAYATTSSVFDKPH